MAQIAIREYDAKKMFFQSIGQIYNGIQIKSKTDLEKLEEGKKYVIKPDMLFGKRGKLGVLGVNLSKSEIIDWYKKKNKKEMIISGVVGTLDVFLVEEFIEHSEEYYVSFEAHRDTDILNFSIEGGIEVEENWEKVKSIKIETGKELQEKDLYPLFEGENSMDKGICAHGEEQEILNKKIPPTPLQKEGIKTFLSLYSFYKNYGFVYLEVNPFCFDTDGNIVILDMVAKIDDQEHFLQKNNWKDLEIPNTFGFKENEREKYIRKLDNQTGASLKFKVLNTEAKIWTLLAGGGGSLVITDSLGALGFAKEVGNYGELSGNPSRDFTREYTRCLLEQMLENGIQGKYLIIAGAIANFTDISTTFAGIIDILEEKKEAILEQKIQILIRRGGINEKKGLSLIKEACENLEIPCKIADSSEYMTDILKNIQLKTSS